MCVIVYKPAGATVKVKSLRECWNSNPHGAGVMFVSQGKVYGLKGLMKFEDLEAFLREADLIEAGKVTADIALTFHFRLATHGGINRNNTHPFPLSGDMKDLTAVEWSAEVGVAHNGIIGIDRIPKGRSDTQTYIRDILSRRRGVKRFDKRTLTAVEWETEGSRLFLLRGDGKYRTTGPWYRNNSGVLFSNMVWWRRARAKEEAARRPAAPTGRTLPMFAQGG